MSGWVSPVSIGVGRSEEAAAEVARTEQDCAVQIGQNPGIVFGFQSANRLDVI